MNTTILLAIISGISLVATGILAFLYLQERGKASSTQDPNKTVTPEEVDPQIRQKMIEADEKAKAVIEQAGFKAQDIIRQAQFLSERVRTKLDQDLEALPKAQEDIYRGVFRKVGDEAVKIIATVAEEMKVRSELEVKEFGKSLQEQAVASQQKTHETIAAAYSRVEQEIQQYKANRLQKVDDTIYDILHEVTAEVLGKSLDLHEHEEIVMESLEAAKRANVI